MKRKEIKAPPESTTMFCRDASKSCETEYCPRVADSILTLQRLIHHKSIAKCMADATTMQRINNVEMSVEDQLECMKATRVVADWLAYDVQWFIYYAKRWLYKHPQESGGPDYSLEGEYNITEIVSELLLSAMRILYNWNPEKEVQPHHYFKTVMYRRVSTYQKQFNTNSWTSAADPSTIDPLAHVCTLWDSFSEGSGRAANYSLPDHVQAEKSEKEYWSEVWDLLVGYDHPERLEALSKRAVTPNQINRPLTRKAKTTVTWAVFAHSLAFALPQFYGSPYYPFWFLHRAWYIALSQK